VAQVQQLITNTVQRLGGVDIMVANAGKLSRKPTLEAVSECIQG
jgi:NAD(P)-dependent dehydrogenase (short-subunit alcohol dehydrogenase family)